MEKKYCFLLAELFHRVFSERNWKRLLSFFEKKRRWGVFNPNFGVKQDLFGENDIRYPSPTMWENPSENGEKKEVERNRLTPPPRLRLAPCGAKKQTRPISEVEVGTAANYSLLSVFSLLSRTPKAPRQTRRHSSLPTYASQGEKRGIFMSRG